MIYHVSKKGNDQNEGSEKAPFLTISKAADIAVAGDSVIVHAGIYRECVNPVNGGTEDKRIVYSSAGDGEVVISGAEPVTDWKRESGDVYYAEVDDALFSHRNPFKTALEGDWLFAGDFTRHVGNVFLNGKSLYEVSGRDKLDAPVPYPEALYPEESKLQWYAEVTDATTRIWANFGGIDPAGENVEITVRPYCFMPQKPGVNYITVKGFTICQAAPQWAPPTAFQEGLIGPHWSKGWIIEDNTICESGCVGISLGTSINTRNGSDYPAGKGGTQREQEVIFRAIRHDGWSKENVGSHIIRNNIIHDCEQAGIVGHMGGAFSTIMKNRIYNIHHKMIYHGAEVSGIKLHGALDTIIEENCISRCYRGIWLDWQAQGTRISRNTFTENRSEDLFIEVCHGPYLADNNLFLSRMNFRNLSQGGAFVHNLFAGRILTQKELTRYTPYHFPHDTAVAGYNNFPNGDDRYYNNIFLGDGDTDTEPKAMTFFEHLPLQNRDGKNGNSQAMDGVPEDAICYLHPVGLGTYNGFADTVEKMPFEFSEEERKERTEKFGGIYRLGRWALPFMTGGNVYLGGAIPADVEKGEKEFCEVPFKYSLVEDKDAVQVNLEVTDPDLYDKELEVPAITGADLGKTFNAEEGYENPDGSMITFDIDFYGKKRTGSSVHAGPFA